MAASRAPHPLAEAIADLAAPPCKPTVIRLAYTCTNGGIFELDEAVILHLRPRPRSAGAAVAIYSGEGEGGNAYHIADWNLEDGTQWRTQLMDAGQLVSLDRADIPTFCSNLVKYGAWERPAYEQDGARRPKCLLQPCNWSKMYADLFPASAVRSSRQDNEYALRFESAPLMSSRIENSAIGFAQEQSQLQALQSAGQELPAGSTLLSSADCLARERELTEQAERDLAAALAAMMDTGLRYLGPQPLPGFHILLNP